ncbi:MAG: hypothetical protein BGO51_28305 [Rhodospirillales bacterium 69-11]|nr:hypothetical protein [Rhodospirillales bacterium]MBN8925771.1 hypothetical protein [Rhodospirillales bacterium]OJW25210.1 MAG: hypothetical protein BGO51_28305 [Rhodospirillales bacterium 69-11]
MPPPYKTAGRCIYCGYVPADLRELTDEHIMPRGLNGPWVIPHASCEKCQKEINKVETACMQGFLMPARLHFQMKRSKRKNGPTKIRVVLERDDGQVEMELGHDKFPFIYLPTFTGPLLALNAPPCVQTINIDIVGVRFEGADRIFAELGANKVHVPHVPNIDAFARMLFKIAHCFAVAELGLQRVIPFLIEEILGTLSLNHNFHVGCSLARPEELDQHMDNLHQLTWFPVPYRGRTLIVVRIQLLSCLAAPAYDVTVGLLRAPPSRDASSSDAESSNVSVGC